MKKTVALRAAAAVVLLAVIVLTMVFLVTGNFNTFTRIAPCRWASCCLSS